VLLIEQFASVALSLAGRAHIMESGQIQYSGTAGELRRNPELLRNAYLLRDAAEGRVRAAASTAPEE
jgi:branched-chain amino acid transport system ATP-binding protein